MSNNHHQPLDSHLNGTVHPLPPLLPVPHSESFPHLNGTAHPLPPLLPVPQSEPFHPSIATTTTTTTTTTSSKRHRRPSVRLGDVGEQPASVIPVESYIRRCKQLNLPIPPHYLQHKDPKTRPLHLFDGKSKRERRVKGNWGGNDFKENEGNSRPTRSPRGEFGGSGDFDDDDDDRGFRREGRSQEEEEKRDDDDVGDAPSETNDRNWSGVRTWLNGLGLGKYAPMFEIHEVDYDVLPLITLEDLKDMGISAVGSRRKMYSAIQSLGKRLRY